MPELVLELVVVESRIDRDGRGSELRAREQRHDPFRPIGEDDRDEITSPKPQFRHRRCEGRRSGIDLRVTLFVAARDDHCVTGVLSRTPMKHPRKRPEIRHQSPLRNPVKLTGTRD